MVNPKQGFSQPHTGLILSLPFSEMKRQSKGERPAAVIRGVLAQNLIALRDRKFPHLPNATKRNFALAEKCKPTSPSQIHRITTQQLGTSVDTLELLAAALEVRPQDLITPYFASLQTAVRAPEALRSDQLQRKTVKAAAFSRSR
jgi:hypothetical protein